MPTDTQCPGLASAATWAMSRTRKFDHVLARARPADGRNRNIDRVFPGQSLVTSRATGELQRGCRRWDDSKDGTDRVAHWDVLTAKAASRFRVDANRVAAIRW